MKALFNLVAALLCISGVLHLVKVFVYPIDPNAIVAVVLTVLFGLAYLAIGVMMFRSAERMMILGAVIPAIGLLLTLVGMKPNPDWFIIAFIILDVLVVAACAYFLYTGKSPIRRLK